MPQFTLEISHSQIAVFNTGLRDPFNHWTDAHFNQGFCWRDGSVSFRTAGKAGKGQITVSRVEAMSLQDDTILAISVPFTITGPSIEVAGILKGELVELEPGDYELIYQTGRNGVTPWVTLQFVPRKIDTATILRGAEHLHPAEPLLMTAEPA